MILALAFDAKGMQGCVNLGTRGRACGSHRVPRKSSSPKPLEEAVLSIATTYHRVSLAKSMQLT